METSTTFTSTELLPGALRLATEWGKNALTSESDWKGLLALMVIANLTLIPLTMVRNAYCFTVGYGASVLTMALGLGLAFEVPFLEFFQTSRPPELWLTLVTLLYGVRLSLFLAWREGSVPRMRDQTGPFQRKPVLMVLPLAVTLGVLYSMMVSPVFYALRNPAKSAAMVSVSWFGVTVASLGLVLEAVADQHKYEAKRHHEIAYGEKRFVGPTSLTYALCRHPNYLGEVMFWMGLWMGSIPSYGTNILAWIITTLGLVCILVIMKGSAERLDKKQKEWYGGQPDFEKWKRNVKGSLVPKLFA
uniref:Steroid 5-alpha reductase C-terminal domain-containing protein n=1 Tax=Amphora coffeiformis TaxID=265554 RepID=A0A7S3L3F8_9STRA|mmetsp:Transcript_8138/g.15748  ORF Transcript_8138/g.15748 Transcript_8138/m.15748 type:complete len:303 (+) Transcript_8138:304-1212(+)